MPPQGSTGLVDDRRAGGSSLTALRTVWSTVITDLSGCVALVLAAALFASRRMMFMMLAVTFVGLLVVAVADGDLTGPDIAGLATEGTVCVLVGSMTSLLASRQRRDLRRAERRLHRSRRESSL